MLNPSFIDRIWYFLSSVKLAIFVFTTIGISSIFGTIIDQSSDPEKNIKLLTKIFGQSIALDVYKIIDTIGLNNMYHSWWFITLLFVFASNLIVCTLERLPSVLKIIKEPIKPINEEQFSNFPIRHHFTLNMHIDKASKLISDAFSKSGFKLYENREDNNIQSYSEKGKYSRLGLYITHISILLLFLGVIAGLFKGFNGYLNLLEGTNSSVAYLQNGQEIPLGFEIRCDDFDVSFYEGSDTPKSYKSNLTIIENGKEVLKQQIEVNSPLRYKGITFYQSSYGFSPSPQSLFHFRITSRSKKQLETKIHFDEQFTIPDTNITVKVADFSPAIAMDESGKLFTYADNMVNPAVFLEFYDGKSIINRQWVLKRFPQSWVFPEGEIEFVDLWGSQYTGLQVRKDPGVWLVYLACLIMSVGLYMSFFMTHKKIWILLKKNANKTDVIIVASTNKYKNTFENKIQETVSSLLKTDK
ncbi:MAG TPA: cytochrome c biogenesis protein ResB [Nitrospirae bacterium]|nr:cytochrome c biogenesis protein ResB [Nitrospirota bacterium]